MTDEASSVVVAVVVATSTPTPTKASLTMTTEDESHHESNVSNNNDNGNHSTGSGCNNHSHNHHNDVATTTTTPQCDDVLSDSELTPPLSNRRRRPNGQYPPTTRQQRQRRIDTNNTNKNNNGYKDYGSLSINDENNNNNDDDDDDDDTKMTQQQQSDDDEHAALMHPKQPTLLTNESGTNGTTSTNSRSRWRWPPPSRNTSGGGSATTGLINNSSQQQQQRGQRSERSLREYRLNQWLECTIVVLVVGIVTACSMTYWYYNIYQKHVVKQMVQTAIATHAHAAEERRQECHLIDWQTACDRMAANPAGARRQLHEQEQTIRRTTGTTTTTSTSKQQQYHYGRNKRMSHGRNHHTTGMNRNKKHHHKSSSKATTPRLIVPNSSIPIREQEDALLQSDDPAVTYDNHCLKVYRLDIRRAEEGGQQITFPYHSSQLLRLGGNHTMVLIIQHGALRNSEAYFCSFKQMMEQQTFRPLEDILIIAPDFNYATDDLVHPNDAVWNSSKPWGDWRVGAQSDPYGIADMTIVENDDGATVTTTTTKRKHSRGSSSNNLFGKLFDHTIIRPTISSFDVLDHMLAIVTDKRLFPNVDKISFVGHSAGGQMVQRYAILSVLAALWFMDTGKGSIDVEFVIANPSSYTYLDPRRYTYNCGTCTCSTSNCTCDQDCTKQESHDNLQIPKRSSINHHNPNRSKFPCYQWNYDRWPYGIGSFTDIGDDGTLEHTVPYALRDGFVGVERATRMYRKLNIVYMVGQNDTCNDGLPTCSADCWKRTNFTNDEWSCFRNDMDTRCPAMLQGPYRRARAYQYMKYLEQLYGEPVHRLHTIPGVGHNATAMFSSEIALRELFD